MFLCSHIVSTEIRIFNVKNKDLLKIKCCLHVSWKISSGIAKKMVFF